MEPNHRIATDWKGVETHEGKRRSPCKKQMDNQILEKARTLLAQGVPCALATVVRRERPTSGEPGDKAIITSDGEFLGWIGGSCAQPTVLAEANKAIADGEPR